MTFAERLVGGRVHYAWIVAGVTFLILLSAAAIRAMPGVLIVPLEQTFGWSRATVSFAVSVNLLLYGLCGPFAASLMERFGVRRITLLSLCAVTVGVALTTVMRSPWQLVLLWGVVVGIGTGAMALVLAATIANRWFVARRGLVIGILTASTATGQLLFLPLLAAVVQHTGWRAAAVPGIVFLSGGQSDVLATRHLNALNALGKAPWALSFSFGRALQAPALSQWAGKASNVPAAQRALLHRAHCNSAARTGQR